MATTLDWFGCATFRLRTGDTTIFLDAYIDRVPGAPGSGMAASEIRECDWIVVGHSHFDHLWGAQDILANTDARLIGSFESIRVLEQAGVPLDRMICVAGGETVELADGLKVSAYPSQHSCMWSAQNMPPADAVCLGELGLTLQEQQERMAQHRKDLVDLDEAAKAHIAAAAPGMSTRGDGGSLVFLLETAEGSVFFQDTAGSWAGVVQGLRANVAILAAAGRPNVDGEPLQGSLAEFVANEARELDARQVVLAHHDNWLPGFSVQTDVDLIREALQSRAPDATLLELDYVDGTRIL